MHPQNQARPKQKIQSGELYKSGGELTEYSILHVIENEKRRNLWNYLNTTETTYGEEYNNFLNCMPQTGQKSAIEKRRKTQNDDRKAKNHITTNY